MIIGIRPLGGSFSKECNPWLPVIVPTRYYRIHTAFNTTVDLHSNLKVIGNIRADILLNVGSVEFKFIPKDSGFFEPVDREVVIRPIGPSRYVYIHGAHRRRIDHKIIPVETSVSLLCTLFPE